MERSRRRARADQHRTYAEEVGLMLSLVIISALALAVLCLMTLAFLDVLPSGIGMMVMLSLLAFVVVLGRAILERAGAVPSIYRTMTPVVRQHH